MMDIRTSLINALSLIYEPKVFFSFLIVIILLRVIGVFNLWLVNL